MHPFLQEYLASVQHSAALEQAHQQAQQALQLQIEDLHSSHAQAMAKEQQLRDAAAQVGTMLRVSRTLGAPAFVAAGSVKMHMALLQSASKGWLAAT